MRDINKRSEAYKYIEKWRETMNLEDVLELLSYKYMDTYIRQYAVMKIGEMDDYDLKLYLFQLIQCIKYELHDNNALIRLLMKRALSNPYDIGIYFYFYIKYEYEENIEYKERFGLYLEEYLLFSPNEIIKDLQIENKICGILINLIDNVQYQHTEQCLVEYLIPTLISGYLREFMFLNNIFIPSDINYIISIYMEMSFLYFKKPEQRINKIIKFELKKINSLNFDSFILPINTKWRFDKFVINECHINVINKR